MISLVIVEYMYERSAPYLAVVPNERRKQRNVAMLKEMIGLDGNVGLYREARSFAGYDVTSR